MGRFSAAVQIKIPADRISFVDSLCDMMRRRGFVPCLKNEAVMSYLLAFSGGWATLTSEEYSVNSEKADEDAVQISSELKADTFVIEIIDSDFAILKLFDGSGKADMVIVGDGSEYGFEKTPKGMRNRWEPLLTDGMAWEQISEVWEKNNVFVEDTLCESASMLGIEPKYLAADYSGLCDNTESDENIIALYFALDNSKVIDKPMSFNSAFVKVFGEGLEPLGFRRLKKIKNKQPYFVRVAGGEILHIISYRTLSCHKSGYKTFEVLGGTVTLYKRNIDFSVRPEELLISANHLFSAFPELDIDPVVMENAVQYECDIWGTDKERTVKRDTLKGAFHNSIFDFLCRNDDSSAMIKGLENALNVTKSIIVGVLDKITDLCSCIEYFYKANQPSARMELCNFDRFIADDRYADSEGLILIKAGYRDDGRERIKNEAVSKIPSLGYQATPENIEKFLKEYVETHEKYRLEQLSFRSEMLDNPELNKRVMRELERCKAVNIELLGNYGFSDIL